MSRLFCYEPQRQSIEAFLLEIGLTLNTGQRRLHGVRERTAIQGHEGGTFVEIEGHPAHVPDDIRQTVTISGFLTVVLSDQFLRARRSRAAHG